ncbi:MAG: DinB family protein [Chitinophagales bacterium]|jgi:hypothetical protein|nr:DinB family protein [Chitinophagales bacterium]
MNAFSDSQNRKAKIKLFGRGYYRLKEVLSTVPKESVHFRSRRDVWNISEMVIHLADLEAAAYVNFRRAVAEPTDTIVAFDKDLWAESLGYYGQSYEASVKLFRLLRASNYLLLKNISQDVWLNTVNYPDNGQISLEDLLDLYEHHLHKVIEEIDNNREAWNKTL